MTKWWRNIEWAAILIMLLGFLAAWRWDRFAEHAARRPGLVLLAEILLIVLFLAALGKSKEQTFLGVLVDEADRASLARFQTFLWIVVLYGGLATVFTVNLARDCKSYPEGATPPTESCTKSIFSTEVPVDLLKLVGITVTANGIAGLVTFQGLNRNLRNASRIRATSQLNGTSYEVRGIIAARKADTRPSLADTVRGSFAPDADGLDFAKVQYLLLNLMIVSAYLVAFAQGMNMDIHQPLGGFPGFDDGLNALLAISAGAYAGIKVFKDAAISE